VKTTKYKSTVRYYATTPIRNNQLYELDSYSMQYLQSYYILNYIPR